MFTQRCNQVSSKSSSKAERVVRYTKADGTQVEKRYAAWQPTAKAPARHTIGVLIDAWQLSPRWKKLKPASQASYGHGIKPRASMAALDARELSRRDLLALRDAIVEARGPGAARDFVTACGALFAFGLDYDWNVQPNIATRLLRDLPKGELPAWTPEDAALALLHLQKRLRRAVVLGMHTGQRRGDLIAMRWSDYDGCTIRIVQQTTGVAMAIPTVPELRIELDACRPSVVDISGQPRGTILTTDAGEPWADTNLSA